MSRARTDVRKADGTLDPNVKPGERDVRERLSSVLAAVHFTPIEKELMRVLADGEPHLIKDMPALIDSQATKHNVANHLWRIRSKIEPYGHAIIVECIDRRLYYRYVILVSSLSEV